jgi:hypothetical protein
MSVDPSTRPLTIFDFLNANFSQGLLASLTAFFSQFTEIGRLYDLRHIPGQFNDSTQRVLMSGPGNALNYEIGIPTFLPITPTYAIAGGGLALAGVIGGPGDAVSQAWIALVNKGLFLTPPPPGVVASFP